MASQESHHHALRAIETARLRLRPCTAGDADDLHRLWTDAYVRRYLWDDIVITRERAAAEINTSIRSFQRRGFGLWVVCLKGESSLVGFCGLRSFGEPAEVEMVVGLAPAYWGRGLATEASRAMLRYGFEEVGLERIYGGADPPNAASIRLMERCGMTFAKKMRVNDIEAVYYAVSRDAFQLQLAPNENDLSGRDRRRRLRATI
ncbi:MAG TPA: GNAT family N-acetyltransferase [Blastocatellia bacterium]|nr:GNAT family N-acetyltransferase [Blastocatellia bacterium]